MPEIHQVYTSIHVYLNSYGHLAQIVICGRLGITVALYPSGEDAQAQATGS
jgi:hypothetical protein